MKNTLFIILLLGYSLAGYSQDYGDYSNSNFYTASQVIGNPTIQPPDVAAFQKVNFIPVSNYTGRANISIPIYEISEGIMNVPISLSYNTSGVKVSDMASSVGLNWSLSAGGMISRMIKGMDDFLVSELGSSSLRSPSGWLGYAVPDYVYYGELNLYNDAEPDLFSVSAPGLSTKYIHKRAYSLYPNVDLIGDGVPDAIELEPQGNLINETIGNVTRSHYNDITETFTDITTFGLTNVEITSIHGVVYTFGTPDLSRHHGNSSSFSNIYKLESYRLDKMFDPSTNQTIDFEYEQYSNYFYDEMISGVTEYGDAPYLGFDPSKNTYTQYPYTQRLKKILFDKGSVEFIYGLARLDNEGDEALTEIKVKDHLGNTVKHVKLSYDYFQSSIDSYTPQSKRLRLDRVYEVDANLVELPGYTFTYDTEYDMPPRGSYAHDFLGYNNGSYSIGNIDPIPKYYFTYSNDPFNRYCDVSPFYDANAIELTGNFTLEANSNYAKTYSLTEITFPTGGKNKYEYELNTFYYKGVNRQGGGLRIKTQELDDGNGNSQILDYTYEGGSIANFPVFAVFDGDFSTNPTTLTALLQTMGINTFMSPQSQLEFTQGAFVGYEKVTVKNGIDNGSKVYFYRSPSDYPNIEPTLTYDHLNWESSNWVAMTSPTLSVDQDFLRGKIAHEEVYNKEGDRLLEKHYTYTLKELDAVSLEYLNKSSSNPLEFCYYEDGTYKLNQGVCGGYYENVDIPIARDVLTTVITKEYPSDINASDPIQIEQNYFYDPQLPLVLQESRSVSSSEEMQGGTNNYKITSYPLQSENREPNEETPEIISPLPYAQELKDLNRLSTPLTIEFQNKDRNTIAREEHYYDSLNVISLKKINFINKDGSITESEIITKRDYKGRILEYQKKDSVYVSRFYGYDDKYLIVEVVNSTYTNMLSKLQNLQTPFNQGTAADANSIRLMMSELRDVMPEAQITSYTHIPLVGISSITDPRGDVIYYDYDNFNRLSVIKNSDGDILQKTNYHYQEGVTPPPSSSLSVSPTSYYFSGVGQSFTIFVTSNTNWTVSYSSLGNWITASPSSGSGNGSVQVNCVAAGSLKPGIVNITNTATGQVYTVTVYWNTFENPI